MTTAASQALEHALALLRSPRDGGLGIGLRLPQGILQLLRIVGGDEQALAEAHAASKASEREVREASVFFVQQVLFAPGADSYRMLGVDPDADDERIKEHYRWLVRWLHPDRNPDEWEAVYADRVNRAWQDLRTRERRAKYDDRRREPTTNPAAIAVARSRMLASSEVELGQPLLWMRWLPHLVLGGLAATAAGAVGLWLVLREQPVEASWAKTEPESAAVVADRIGPPPVLPEASATPALRNTEASPAEASVEAQDAQQLADSRVLDQRASLAAAAATATTRSALVPAALAVSKPTQKTNRSAVVSPPTEQRLPLAPATTPSETAPSLAANPPPPISAKTANRLDSASLPIGDADDREAQQLLAQYRLAYEAGDIRRLRSLFANVDRSTDAARTLRAYRQLFDDSLRRDLSMHDVSWFRQGDTLVIIASYRTTVVPRSAGLPLRTEGDLRFDLRQVGEEWRIFRLSYEEADG